MLTGDETAFLNEVLKGNTDAVEYCQDLFQISQIWDDLIDKDEPVSDESINAMMWLALVQLPYNKFYMENINALQPIMQKAILDWLAANHMENGTPQERVVAYVLRDTLTTIVTHCALLIGGYEWAQFVSIRVREALHDEDMDEYLKGVSKDG